jgi:hypothetical protein
MRRAYKILASVVFAMMVASALAYAFRDALATAMVAFVADRQTKARCNHPRVAISANLETVTFSPLDCVVSSGPIQRATTDSEVVVELKSFKAETVRVAKATLNQRERSLANVECNVMGELVKLQGAGDQLMKGMLDASELYAAEGPQVHVDRLTMQRAGKTESIMVGFRKSTDDQWDRTQTSRVGGNGIDLVTVTDLDMHVTPSRGRLVANIHLGKAQPGDAPDIRLKMEGRKLNHAKPHFDMELVLGG